MKKFIFICALASLNNSAYASNNRSKKHIDNNGNLLATDQPILDTPTKYQLLKNSVQFTQRAQEMAEKSLAAHEILDNKTQLTCLGTVCFYWCVKPIVDHNHKIADTELTAAQKLMDISCKTAEFIKLMER